MTSKPTVLKSIFFSGILHVFLFTVFTFSLTLKPFKPKPFFLFLGSLLQKQDFLVAPSDHSLAPLDIKIGEMRTEEKRRTPSAISLSKPALSKTLKTPGKTSWKPFLAKEMEDKAGSLKPPSLKNLGIEPEVPSYAPLKLYPP